AALAAPFHRPSELLRRIADQRVLGRKAGLHAEAAADVTDDDPELVRPLAKHSAQQLARAGRGLVLRVECRAAVGEDADRAARLERRRDQALVVHFEIGRASCRAAGGGWVWG